MPERSGEYTRVPPGQKTTRKLPVLHDGEVPAVDVAGWDFRVFGLVEAPIRFSYDGFMKLPRVTTKADVHCVTGWSRLGNVWEGVTSRKVLGRVELEPEARFVMIHAENDFTTNLSLDDFLTDDVIFAFKLDGRELTPEHGWPLRLVVPHLYFWKSAKWVRGIELVQDERPGYWESRGYHLHGDPWREERYS